MKKSIPLLFGLLVLAALHGHGQNFHKVDTPKLDKADIKAERSWQRGSGGDDSRVVTREWNWLTMNETDLFQHAMPVLEANVGLCGERVLFVPDDMDGQKKICDFLPFIVEDSAPNAFTDGKAVYFTKGMLREFRNPDEYRAVLGHEIGHVLAGHLRKKQRNAAIGSVLGGLAAAAAGVGGASRERRGESRRLGVDRLQQEIRIGGGLHRRVFHRPQWWQRRRGRRDVAKMGRGGERQLFRLASVFQRAVRAVEGHRRGDRPQTGKWGSPRTQPEETRPLNMSIARRT